MSEEVQGAASEDVNKTKRGARRKLNKFQKTEAVNAILITQLCICRKMSTRIYCYLNMGLKNIFVAHPFSKIAVTFEPLLEF